jgi:chromosome segregation ATPase
MTESPPDIMSNFVGKELVPLAASKVRHPGGEDVVVVHGADGATPSTTLGCTVSMQDIITKIALLQDEIAFLRGQNVDLLGQVASLRGQNVDLLGQVASLRGQNVDLLGQNVDLLGQVASLRGEVASLQDEVADLRPLISASQVRIQKLEDTVFNQEFMMNRDQVVTDQRQEALDAIL